MTKTLLAIARDVRDDRAMAEQICQACVAGLDVDGAAISLLTASPTRETLHATDATADLLEELQFTLGEGPCIHAALTARPVLVPDLDDSTETDEWPVFAGALTERARVGALFALPLQWGVINLGVLDLYRKSPGRLSDAQWQDALAATDTATLMLLGLRTDPGGGQRLDYSVGSHAEIHQATGMVAAQLGVHAQDAFARLRAHAFAEQRLLGEVAREVVTRRLRFSEPPDGRGRGSVRR